MYYITADHHVLQYYRKAGNLEFYQVSHLLANWVCHHARSTSLTVTQSDWTVENNQVCMDIVAQMGGSLVGFKSGAANGAVGDLSYVLGKYTDVP